jgi:hypothetical protein
MSNYRIRRGVEGAAQPNLKSKTIDRGSQERPKKLRTEIERSVYEDFGSNPDPVLTCTVQGFTLDLVKNWHGTHLGNTPFGVGGRGEGTSESEFMAAYGSQDSDFVCGLMRQLADIGPQGKLPDVNGFKFLLGAVRATAPRDAVEAMLSTQMAAVHAISTRFVERLGRATPYVLDMAIEEQSLNRLLRTHLTLATTFDRHRRKRRIADVIAVNGSAMFKRQWYTCSP